MASGFSVQDVLTLAATVCSCKYLPYPGVTLEKHAMFSELNAVSIGRHGSKFFTRFFSFHSARGPTLQMAALTPIHLQAFYKLPIIIKKEGSSDSLSIIVQGEIKNHPSKQLIQTGQLLLCR